METAAWNIAKEPHQGDTNPSRLPCVQFCVPWNLWYQPQGRAADLSGGKRAGKEPKNAVENGTIHHFKVLH